MKTALPVVRLSRIPEEPDRRPWLVEHLWADEAVGCVGGAPKAGKTWLSMEIALAVASGRPALGRFAVPRPGPVVMYAAEDHAVAVKHRMSGLCHARNVNFDTLQVGLIVVPELRLDRADHRDAIAQTLSVCKARLLMLDPLVRLHRGDENSAAEMSQLLGFLRTMQREHHLAVLLVHHVRKSAASQPGQALRGSGDLHAWGDSNLYLTKRQDQLQLHVEHRAHQAPPPMPIQLEGDPPRMTVRDPQPELVGADLDARIIEALRREPLSRGVLRDRLRVRNLVLGAALDRLEAQGHLARTEGGLVVVPVPVP